MNDTQRAVLVNSWLAKAESALRDAELLKQNGRLDACVNRLYYAVFYAASALLAHRGQSYGRHAAVRAAVHRDFVKAGLLDQDCGRIYDVLMSRREQADYRPAVTFSADEVDEYHARSRDMIQALKAIIEKNA